MWLTFLISSIIIRSTLGHVYLLRGSWKFYSPEKNYSGIGTVPGDIYTDLHKNGLVDDPLYGENDQNLSWVGRAKWTYEKEFDLSDDVIQSKEIILHAKGLDTIATVYLNDKLMFKTKNQFIASAVSAKTNLRPKGNVIRIEFDSPVKYAEQESNFYAAKVGHHIPPDCPPNMFHGECHANFIRKAQASFSWDWGPSFPTVGVSRPIFLEYFDDVAITQISPLVIKNRDPNSFNVSVDVFIFCAPSITSIVLTTTLPELDISTGKAFDINCTSEKPRKLSDTIKVPADKVKLWYPNGYGEQTLYKLLVAIQKDGHALTKKSTNIGFRTVELNQDWIDEKNRTKGRNFYFKVNDIPIFLKGSNFIPISSFPAQNHTSRKKYLFQSMKEANMNALRVWGGGLYESETFYELADEHGILLWHDLMFACALYPINEEFLQEVGNEVISQVYRIRHHPSILVWAGNNENELAIRSHWWGLVDYNEDAQVQDYVKLYRDLLKPIVNQVDPSRPFLLSSPSNGIQTEEHVDLFDHKIRFFREGGVARNPGSEFYGDIHFYNEFLNLWKDASYQIPRCATEYGVQSIPLKSTMTHWINESQWTYASKSMHHPGGIASLLSMTFMHFEIPKQCSSGDRYSLSECGYTKNSRKFIDGFSFLTQVHQAIAMQVQSEHYRRWRGRVHPDGRGNTMCALYWQLNDVWAAPTWSSIDYDQNWKVLHYYARRFFTPIIVSMYMNGNDLLEVFVVSDKTKPLVNHTLKLDMLAWRNGFSPVYSINKQIDVKPLASVQVDIEDGLQERIRSTLKGDEEFVVRATLVGPNGQPVSPTATLLPDKMYQVRANNYGDANVTNIMKLNQDEYEIELNASGIVPVLWLDLRTEVKRKYEPIFWFSDNAFVMTEKTLKVALKIISSKSDFQISKEDITTCHIASC